jgi:hypothetical protein
VRRRERVVNEVWYSNQTIVSRSRVGGDVTELLLRDSNHCRARTNFYSISSSLSVRACTRAVYPACRHNRYSALLLGSIQPAMSVYDTHPQSFHSHPTFSLSRALTLPRHSKPLTFLLRLPPTPRASAVDLDYIPRHVCAAITGEEENQTRKVGGLTHAASGLAFG